MIRLKKLVKRTAISLLLVISVMILIVAFATWRAAREVEARLAPLRESGKPISIQDLKPSPVPAAQNAAKVVQHYDDPLRKFDRLSAEAIAQIETETETQRNAATIRVAKSVAQEFPELNDALRAASELPAYQLDLNDLGEPSAMADQLINPIVSPRTIVRALYAHGLMSLAAGDTDEALRDAIAILNWSQHVARQPLLVSHLIATACYAQGIELAAKCLDAGDASPALRTAFLAICADESSMRANFADSLDSERAFGISSFDSLPFSRFQWMLGELVLYLDAIHDFESFADAPTGIAREGPTTSSTFAGLIWPSLKQGFLALRRQQALSRAIRILAAWQAAGSDRGATLADLDLPASVVTDPYTGLPMKMQVAADTITLYSVGKDMLDDGGSIAEGRDIGIAL